MSKKLVSVIIPTYNRSHLLPSTIDSVFAQNISNLEIIIIDDGSIDNTCSVVSKLYAQYPDQIKYIYQHNKGPSSARNLGLQFSTAKYIAFLDSDDLWDPDHLKTAIEFLETHSNVHWFFGDLCRMRNDKVIVPSVVKEKKRPLFFKYAERLEGSFYFIRGGGKNSILALDSFARLQTSVVRREVFDKIKFWEEVRLGEDRLIVFEALYNGFNFIYHDYIHGIFRIHDHHITLGKTNDPFLKREAVFLDLLKVYKKILDNYHLNLNVRFFVKREIFKILFWELGYNTYFNNNFYNKAFRSFTEALIYWPFSLSSYKTLFLFFVRYFIRYTKYMLSKL